LPASERNVFDLLALAGHLGQEPPNAAANLSLFDGKRDPRRRLRQHVSRHFPPRRPGAWRAAADGLVGRLLRVLRDHQREESGSALLTLMNNASIALAPDCKVPTDTVLAVAWSAQVRLFARLFGTGVKHLGKLPWLDSRALAALRRESLGHAVAGEPPRPARPGPRSRRLAVDRRLMTRVSRALGRRSKPGYEARYLLYRRAGDYFWPHPDDPEYAVNVLVCLERQLPEGQTSGSAFLAYSADGSMRRFELNAGEALAVEARGLVHAREPLAQGERLTLLSIAVH
jgi:hypothetical protein